MNKQLKTLAAATLASLVTTTASAGSLNLDMRFDYDNVGYNTDSANSAISGKNDFTMQTGRLDYKGKFNDELSYRFRWRFNRSEATQRNDSLNQEIDYAMLAHKMGDFTLSIGKMASDLGGFDGTQAGSDVYLKSRNFAGLQDGLTYFSAITATGTNVSGRRAFISGAKGSYMMGDHELSVYFSNDSEVTAPTAQSRLTNGVHYKGAVMDKMLTIYADYATEKANAPVASPATNLDSKFTYSNVGLKFEVPDYFVAFDYAANSFGKVNVPSAAKASDLNQTSMVLNAGYNWDKYTFKAMYDSSIVKTASALDGSADGKNTWTGYSLAAEYRPTADKNFRYHVAATQQSLTIDGVTGTPTETHIIAGVRLNADFMK